MTDDEIKKALELRNKRDEESLHQLKHVGNVGETLNDENEIRRRLKYSPVDNPCPICAIIKDRKNIESFSLAQTVIRKVNEADKKVTYQLHPFRHYDSIQYVSSGIFADCGRLIAIAGAILKASGFKFSRMHVEIDGKERDLASHATVQVDFYRE